MMNKQTLPLCAEHFPFDIYKALNQLKSEADWVRLRFLSECTQSRGFRSGKSETQNMTLERGVQVEVLVNGHLGYASTSNLTDTGLKKALATAKAMTQISSSKKAFEFSPQLRPITRGQYQTLAGQTPDQVGLGDLLEFLRLASVKMKVSDLVVSTLAEMMFTESEHHFVSSDGTDFSQKLFLWNSNFIATAQEGHESQRRSLNGSTARCSQGGFEQIEKDHVLDSCERIGHEAIQLLKAENCPEGTMDLVLAPDQMLLQIHESIGHPLELDRILGDERNYAGWSFLKTSDFGNLQYGSDLMNVTFDPTQKNEYATYAFDDCGNLATKEHLIKKGLLVRGLGSLESQTRSGVPGVANFRSASWNRAPIDRMANINLEPGTSSLDDIIGGIEKGVWMEANNSWSIDDYRNKFQFGCEYGRMIEHGQLTRVLKNPNYRGMTVPFWRSLKKVGNSSTARRFGSPYCGKGEPSQVIRVGHSSPVCQFSNVEVFGGSK